MSGLNLANEMQKTFNLINKFWTEFEKIKKNISHVGGYDGFCQCESEKVIEKMTNPIESRSFLIIGMLVDQAVNSYSSLPENKIYEEFRSVFTYPKLVAHFDGSECSSSWFCYPSHGYDKKVDWLNVEEISKVIFPETKDWLIKNNGLIFYQSIHNLIVKDITSNFRANPETKKLLQFVESFF